MKVLVIGSGPAAWASCNALMDKGLKPIVWDTGNELDDDTKAFSESLKEKTTFTLSQTDEQRLYGQSGSDEEFPKKRLYGSDFFHGFDHDQSPITYKNPLLAPSFARGGLAVGWGGAVLPIQSEDMSTWPIKRSDLDVHFDRIYKRLPVAQGGVTDVFPLHREDVGNLPVSERLKGVQAHLDAGKDDDLCQRARLALHTDGKNACNGCGLCLTGCPQGAIFSFADEFKKWIKGGKIEYCSGRTVIRLEEQNQKPVVHYLQDDNFAGFDRFDKVFVAAGAISSTRIVLESLGKFDEPVKLLDSQKFILPMFQLNGADKTKPTFELPSLFWDFKYGSHWTHLQINEAGRFTTEFLPKFMPVSLKKMIIRHMLIGWGGLHSDDSRSFDLTMLRAHRNARPVLYIKEQGSVREVSGLIRRITWRMSKKLCKAGIFTMPLLAQIAPQGGGFHCGGSMAMADQAKSDLCTDVLGRNKAWKAIHFIDGSVLPTLPATTVALNIMANADRIVEGALS